MADAQWYHLLFLLLAVVLEVSANLFIKASDGFQRRLHGIMGIACILAAFAALTRAVQGMDLSVAYAAWGGCGILLTLLLGRTLFGQRLQPFGWLGVACMVGGMALLKMA